MRVFWLVLVALASACATAGPTSAQRQKASDCAAMCERTQPPPPSGPMGKPAGSVRDTRSDCDKRCGM
jgi:hypothetical protein